MRRKWILQALSSSTSRKKLGICLQVENGKKKEVKRRSKKRLKKEKTPEPFLDELNTSSGNSSDEDDSQDTEEWYNERQAKMMQRMIPGPWQVVLTSCGTCGEEFYLLKYLLRHSCLLSIGTQPGAEKLKEKVTWWLGGIAINR